MSNVSEYLAILDLSPGAKWTLQWMLDSSSNLFRFSDLAAALGPTRKTKEIIDELLSKGFISKRDYKGDAWYFISNTPLLHIKAADVGGFDAIL